MIRFLLLLLSLSLGLNNITSQELQPANSPSRAQRLMLQRAYGMFITYGINTFAETEWSDGSIPASRYNPTELDCDQWIRVARDAGFRYILLTTKHHDGFCLWDSKYTDYDVASSPVKTDVVAEVAKACKKYGLKFAVYYSFWDRHEPTYRDPDFGKYIDFMCNQLEELLTNYGKICEVWFDGAWDKKAADWEMPRIYRLIKKLQPDCVVGVNQTIMNTEEGAAAFGSPAGRHLIPLEKMTEDNKYYIQYFPSDFRLWDPRVAHVKDKKQYLYNGKSYYLPFEHTVCISKYWTRYAKKDPEPCRDLDELEELFYQCTANGNTLLLNLPPDQRGKIRAHEANTAILLAQRLGLKKGKPLPQNGTFVNLDAKAEASSVWENNEKAFGPQKAVDGGMLSRWAASELLPELVIDLDSQKSFNKLAIYEYMDQVYVNNGFTNYRKNRIQRYTIDVERKGEWETVYVGDQPMNDCKVIKFAAPVKADKIRLKVLAATEIPSIYEFRVISMP